MIFSRLFGHAGQKKPELIRQSEMSECGIACLAMVANWHGHELDLASLRRKFPTSSRGLTLGALTKYAAELGLESKAMKVPLAYLERLDKPAILHWDLSHFVVLSDARGDRIEIYDPAKGVCRLSLAQASDHFTGIALELRPGNSFVPEQERTPISLRQVIGRVSGFGRALAQVILIALAIQLIVLMLPFYLQWVIDQAITTEDQSLLALLAIGFAITTMFQSTLALARGWAITWIGSRLSEQWTMNVFAHLMRLPLTYFENRHLGDIMSRFNSILTVQKTLTGTFIETVLNGVVGFLALLVLLMYSPTLAMLVLLALLIYAGARWLWQARLWRATEQQLIVLARQQTHLLESVRCAQALKLAGKEALRGAKFAQLTQSAFTRDMQLQRMNFGFAALNQLIFGCLRVLLIFLGAHLVLRKQLSIGMMIAFVTYAEQLTSCFANLVDRIVDFKMLKLHAYRIADIVLNPTEDLKPERTQMALGEFQIHLDNVSFRYGASEPWILRNCSLSIQSGECVAIAGPSGCGKSTLAKLLLGLLEPTEGVIRISYKDMPSQDIRQFGIASYRALFSAVMQDDSLFDGTIAENIAFLDEDAKPEQIQEAARLAVIHEDIARFPMHYETRIGNMGSTVSGGQRQRLFVARALYQQRPILLLDEATSHLDEGNEQLINANIKKLAATRVVIAHRKETIASADRVIYLDANVSALKKAA
jgi:ATP-binding cassette, subfamily B, bacterial CvaB/MchF/RaxB